jgi:iron complex outermembrane receptor protein
MLNWHIKVFFGLGLSAALSSYAFSDEWVITEDDLFAEIDTVSGVTHLQQDLQQVPAAVTIIDRRTIESSTAVDLVDLFRLVPGFQVYFSHTNKPGVTYHVPGGEYSRRLEVKIDGRSVYEPLLSSVEWNTLGLELDDIDYIEVVRGSNAAADGSNAFFATINFVTRSPLAESGISFSQKVGSNGLKSSAISHSAQFGQLATRGVIRVSQNDGSSGNGDFADTLVMRYQGLWTPTVADTISFQIGKGDTETIVELVDKDDPTDKLFERHWKSNYQHLEWKRIVNDWSDIELSIYHNAIDFVDEDWGFTVNDIAAIFDQTLSDGAKLLLMADPDRDKKFIVKPTYAHFSDRWDAEIRSNIYRRDDLRASIGLASRQDSLRSELFLSNSDTSKAKQASNRVYANLEWTANDKLVLNYGQVIEQRKNKASTNSFRIAANYAPSKQHVFRVASSHSYREPTLLEENQYSAYYYDGIVMGVNVKADEEIEKERLISREIGYLGSFLGSNLSLDVRIFEERLSDLIGERREPYESPTQSKVNVIDNISETLDLRGLEWQLQYKPSNRLLVNLNHSYLQSKGDRLFRTYDAEDPDLEDAGCELKNYDEICDLKDVVPSNMVNLLVSYKMMGGIKLSGSYHYKSGFKAGYMRPSTTRIDFKASKGWHYGNHWLELSLTAQNLGSDYIEYNEFNNFESKYVLGFKMGSK